MSSELSLASHSIVCFELADHLQTICRSSPPAELGGEAISPEQLHAEAVALLFSALELARATASNAGMADAFADELHDML